MDWLLFKFLRHVTPALKVTQVFETKQLSK